MEDEDLIEREDMVVTITHGGKDDDFITNLFVANTHTPLLFFTTDGMVYKLKTWRLPPGGRNAKGKAIVNILPIPQGVSIAAIMPVDREEEDWKDLQIVFATSDGDVRKNARKSHPLLHHRRARLPITQLHRCARDQTTRERRRRLHVRNPSL